MSEVADRFSDLVAATDFTMYVVTVAGADDRSGCLVGFATQASIDPPRLLVGLSKANHTTHVAASASFLGVHVIPRDDLALVRLFGGETGDEVDKFEHCAWTDGPHGVPVLSDAAAWFVGRIESRTDMGDHIGHLLAPVEVEIRGLPPLVSFSQVKDMDPGHEA